MVLTLTVILQCLDNSCLLKNRWEMFLKYNYTIKKCRMQKIEKLKTKRFRLFTLMYFFYYYLMEYERAANFKKINKYSNELMIERRNKFNANRIQLKFVTFSLLVNNTDYELRRVEITVIYGTIDMK